MLSRLLINVSGLQLVTTILNHYHNSRLPPNEILSSIQSTNHIHPPPSPKPLSRLPTIHIPTPILYPNQLIPTLPLPSHIPSKTPQAPSYNIEHSTPPKYPPPFPRPTYTSPQPPSCKDFPLHPSIPRINPSLNLPSITSAPQAPSQNLPQLLSP